jgi:cyclophilin family peptidyl-prolyl cis-trans isomerase
MTKAILNTNHGAIEFELFDDAAPKTVARPTTLGACQVRLQLSMLFVRNATRASFCARKFTSFVDFEQLKIPTESGP